MNPAEAERRIGHRDLLMAHFRANPYRWIAAQDLIKLGGQMAWRTRISDARKMFKREGGDILNRQQWTRREVLSQYMYLQQSPLGPSAETPREQRLFP